jgi:putative alpha-1,2-mannosidase
VATLGLVLLPAGCTYTSAGLWDAAAPWDAGDVWDAGADAGTSDDAGPVPDSDLTGYVDPFIGTDDSSSPFPVPGGAGGSTYPGAVAPFGMVQFGPDTPTASPSGYRFSDTEIEQLSLTHLNGAGCPNDEDLPILPTVGALTASPGGDWPSFRSAYLKGTEIAAPGFYQVDLLRYGVRLALTATTRTAFARFTYPASQVSQVLVHAGRSATGLRSGSIEIVAPDRMQGTVTAGGFCGASGTFPIHFVIVFDRPFSGSGTWLGQTITPGSTMATGVPSGGYVTFDTTAEPVVQMKIGLSYVSIANAQANLDAEAPGWDFEQVRAKTRADWNRVLNRIQVSGGTDADLKKFYTALYHVFSNPNVASDVNGEYMGFDGAVHRAQRPTYQNYSGWDIIRSWTHLMGAVAPETPDIIASMVQDGVEGGLLPFWSHQTVETHVMVGDPGTVNVANAYAMGVRGFDADRALALMKESAENPLHTNRWALGDWLNLHYVGNASVTEEYAMADFALGQFASALGHADTQKTYLDRSTYWTNSWNADAGFIEPRAGAPAPGADAARLYEVQIYDPSMPATDLALGGVATASASCNSNEGPDKAINGTWTGGNSDKWCDNVSAQKWWQVDLGAVYNVGRVVIHHAGAGGELSAWDTQDFTLEVSTDAAMWTVAAAVIGNTADVSTHDFSPLNAQYLRIRITNAIQMLPRGSWDCQPLNPGSDCGFIEGNAAQYLWMVPHDLEGLFTRMGGHDVAIARLDTLFTELNAGTSRPYFYIGNEPEHATPWTYNFAQAPWKTQAVVRRIIASQFNTSPGGLPGNDDLGATSAWLVWAYLGMYPVIPGTDVLVLNGPFFTSATIRLANGKVLTLHGAGATEASPFISGLSVDGTASTRNWLHFSEIAEGSTLDFTMSDAPNIAWGSGPTDVPPSFVPDDAHR